MSQKKDFASIIERNKYVVKEKNAGTVNRDIAADTRLSVRQIQNIYKTATTTGRLRRKKGSGRPRVLSRGDKIRIRKALRENPYQSCKNLRWSLGIQASADTINRFLLEANLSHKKANRVPHLTVDHMTERLRWANSHKRYPWTKVIFSDETTFRLNEPQYGWAPRGTPIRQRSRTYNPKVQLWGSISYYGAIAFTTYEGSMTSNRYVNVLQQELIPAANEGMRGRWVLQQDNARPNTANNTYDFFDREGIEVLDWPSNSPDLNPIENLWAVLKKGVYQWNPQDLDDLKMCIEDEIDNLDRNYMSNLIRSMKNKWIC